MYISAGNSVGNNELYLRVKVTQMNHIGTEMRIKIPKA